jgi:hypothetical protein
MAIAPHPAAGASASFNLSYLDEFLILRRSSSAVAHALIYRVCLPMLTLSSDARLNSSA